MDVILQKLHGSLAEQAAELKRKYEADVIVNCAGLGAMELTGEHMFPLRGAVVRLINDGTGAPKLDQAHYVSHDDVTREDEIVFIVPRGENRIVLGAIAEVDEWDKNINLDYEPVRRIYERCIAFMPSLRNLRIDPEEPVRVGLRPFRKQNVRLDVDESARIVHNYGHVGAGITFSWGCAIEAAEATQALLT